MKLILTLTLNSSVDVQWEVPRLEPTKKLRSSVPLSFPGGGGINVSRAIRNLGGQSIAVHTGGGDTGYFFREMVERAGLLTRTIPIAEETRVSATVYDVSDGKEYRITPPGPELSEEEWQACLDAIFEYPAEIIVATGSLPRGVPQDFYGRVATRARESGQQVIVDTTGAALQAALDAGVYLVKPNLGELERYVGAPLPGLDDQMAACRKIVEDGKSEVVALTMGHRGALMVTGFETVHLATPAVEVRSAVGAGDSFVGGITYGLARNMPLAEAFHLGVACGTATVLTPGTELCRMEDVERLYQQMLRRPLTFPRERSPRRRPPRRNS